MLGCRRDSCKAWWQSGKHQPAWQLQAHSPAPCGPFSSPRHETEPGLPWAARDPYHDSSSVAGRACGAWRACAHHSCPYHGMHPWEPAAPGLLLPLHSPTVHHPPAAPSSLTREVQRCSSSLRDHDVSHSWRKAASHPGVHSPVRALRQEAKQSSKALGCPPGADDRDIHSAG